MKNIIRWIGLCAMAFAGYPTWSQAPRPIVAPVSTATLKTPVLLAAQPTRQALSDAKSVLFNGAIVKMENESATDFNAWLGTSVPSMAPKAASTIAEAAARKKPLKAKIVAARYAPDGTLHGYQCTVIPKTGHPAVELASPAANPCEASFADWSKAESGNPSALDLPGPEIFDWTPMGQFSSVVINGDDNSFDNRLRIYRLNDMDATYDWYMVLRDPVSTPHYYHCVPSAHCGWYTEKRDFQFSIPAAELQSGVSLYDWSPKQPIGSSSGQLTLGLSLTGVAPSPSMGYTYSWTQEDVKTEVYANLSKNEASWVERFKGDSGANAAAHHVTVHLHEPSRRDLPGAGGNQIVRRQFV
jgi:hypothetical protein